jgi:hypothetical protein
MVTINISTPLFGTGYYTENHHTEATTLTPEELAAAKVDRFFIELDNDPANATAIIGTGTMTFTDTGPVANNATMDVNPDYDFANVSSAHLEQVVGDMWGVPGQDMTLHDGTDIDSSGTFACTVCALTAIKALATALQLWAIWCKSLKMTRHPYGISSSQLLTKTCQTWSCPRPESRSQAMYQS